MNIDMSEYIHAKEFANIVGMNYGTIMHRIYKGYYPDVVKNGCHSYINKNYLYNKWKPPRMKTLNSPSEEMITLKEAGAILGVCAAMVCRLAKKGVFGNVVKRSKYVFVNINNVMEFFKSYNPRRIKNGKC